MPTDFFASEKGLFRQQIKCEYNYIICFGSNNELHEADMKASYHCAIMLSGVFAGCICDIVGIAVLWLTCEEKNVIFGLFTCMQILQPNEWIITF